MGSYIWLFPLLFIFHDMEEIIGFGAWGKKNMSLLEKRIPKFAPMYKKILANYSTEGMALAVFEELVLCIAVCLISIFCNFFQLWIGLFLAFAVHLVIHILQAVIWRGYIPAVATSIITLPISVVVICQSLEYLGYTTGTVVLWSVIGLCIIAANLKLAHLLMYWFTDKLNNLS